LYGMEAIWLILFFVAWVFVQAYLLPRFGVST
jgi:hypothetical protein